MSTNCFDPGTHRFMPPATGLVLEYIVFRPAGINTDNVRRKFIMAQCPGWGLGSSYLQHGLSDLWAPSSSSVNDTEPTVYTVIFLHPRGTGGSSQSISSGKMSTMPDMVSDIEELRKHLEVEQFPFLLGHSNGGAIALGYAEMFPDRVQKLILIDHQIIGMQDRKTDKLVATKDNPAYRGAWDNLVNRRADTDDELTDSVNSIWPLYFYDPAKYTDELLHAIGDQRMSVWTYHSQAHCDRHLLNPTQMADGLKYVRAKTLVIFGQDDMITGLKIAVRTMDIPGAELITYKECGHFPWIEQKAHFMRDIRGFIEGRKS
jgi:pimeloyl-ACP methyl ester carboxylesterase